MRYFLLGILFLLMGSLGYAQVKSKTLFFKGDTLQIDSLSLIPNSIKIYDSNGNKIDTTFFIIDPIRAQIIWKPNSTLKNQSIVVEYKTFPINFYEPYYHKDPQQISKNVSLTLNPFKYKAVPRTQEDIFELGGLEKSGSISRGIGFGNSRDMSVSSSMNLQLNGKISENLYVMAAITDENIPIQPEGNTQQLQDFDQVYIQIYNDRAKLIAGDYMLKSKGSYFMRYLKKAQGLSGESRFYLGKNKLDTAKAAKMDVQLSGALSRGKFSRNIIQGVEGNQGPYRLRGQENEPYIIILSGTERVYIDGKLLERGQNHDYVINYNTAELTFTARQIITKDKRIIVQFQYADQYYTRSLVQFADHFEYQNLKLDFNIYSEQDAKNQNLQQDLSDEQKAILTHVGDSLNQAVSSGIKSTEFNDNEVLYKMIDSLGYDSVLVYSTSPDSAFYQVTFSEVGLGKGNYIFLKNIANGRVYQWVEPANGVPQGNFEPVVLLYSPKQRQMVSLNGSYTFNKNSELSFEGAVSNNDLNTFSDKHTEDNIGYAGKLNWKHSIDLSKNSKWKASPQLGYEHWSKYFTEIERIRTAEFYRGWNLRNVKLTEDQNITYAGMSLNYANNGSLGYTWGGFYSGSDYNANNHNLLLKWKGKKNIVDFNGNYLSTQGKIKQSEFIRHKTYVEQELFWFRLGFRDDREDNQIQAPEGDTLSADSYRFWEREVFVKSPDSSALEYKLFYNQRDDEKALNNELIPITFGESVGLSLNWKNNRNIQLGTKNTYRKLEIRNASLAQLEPDENLLSRVEYNLRLFKGAITASSFYEIGSGLEAGREFQFIEVPAGQGEYTWIDYNNNGIKELNEFEIAVYEDEKKYIKVSILTDNYVKVFGNQFNQSLMLNPSRIWRKKEGVLKFLARFTNQFAYRLNRKTQSENLDARFNPLPNSGIDSQLVSLNSSLRNTIYFNRTHPVFGSDYTFQDIRSRIFLTNGFESRQNLFHTLRGRVNMGKLFLSELEGKWGNKLSRADYASTRNYRIQYYSLKPKITFQKGVSFRVSASYTYETKQNLVELGGEHGEMQKIGMESKLNKVGKGSFLAEVNYIHYTYNGNLSNSLAYEMLEGLQPGNNATWQVTYQRNIGKYLQLDLNYNGRQSEDSKTIHAGSVRMRAYF